jgi:hypothetical protein
VRRAVFSIIYLVNIDIINSQGKTIVSPSSFLKPHASFLSQVLDEIAVGVKLADSILVEVIFVPL